MADECGTTPDYTTGVGIADKAVTIVSTLTRLLKRTRPAGRVAED